MRLAIDATALGSGRGGDETYMRSILRGLSDVISNDDTLDAYTRVESAFGDGAGDDAVPSSDAVASSDSVHWKRLTNGGSRRLVTSLPRAWRNGIYDAVMAYTHAPIPAPANRALIVTDLSFRHFPAHYPRSARWRLNSIVPRQARQARVVATLSEFCRQDLIDSYQLDPARVQIVPCAVEPADPLSPDEITAGKKWLRNLGIDRPFVLYLGNLHPRKNVAHLIESFSNTAAARAGEVALVIAGAQWWDGGGEEGAVEAAAAGSVFSIGRVTDRQRRYLLASAECLTYPSLFEGFGLPPLEAMAAGTPVVTSNCTAIPEVVGDAALLVDPTDRAELADAIDRVVSDTTLTQTLRTRGRAQVDLFNHRSTGAAAYRVLQAAAQ